MGRVGGANTLGAEAEEPGRLLLLISFAMDLGSTGGASSLSVYGASKAFSNNRVVPVSAWPVQADAESWMSVFGN